MEYTAFTNKGKREYNEDFFGVAEHQASTCYVLADGLGGHGGGDIASMTAVKTICSLFEQDGYNDAFFESAFQKAQEEIFRKQEEENALSKMKTTLVVLVIHEGKAYYAHVGDSRLYILKKHSIKKRTMDHSVPQMLAISGEIKDAEIRHHPDRSRLMRVMGVRGEKPRCEIGTPIKLRGSMSFLLCTDGYWELIEDKDIERINSQSKTPEEWVIGMNKMIQLNGEGTDMDNYSAIAIYLEAGGLFG